MIYEHQMQDIHLDINGPYDKGYTWDSAKNVLIGLILPCDNRRMRLDRIVVNQQSKSLRFSNIFMFGNKKMKFSRMCRRYHASDHFGLGCVFQHNKSLTLPEMFDYESNKEKIWSGVDPTKTGFRDFKCIIRCRIVWLTFLGISILSCLGIGGYFLIKLLISISKN